MRLLHLSQQSEGFCREEVQQSGIPLLGEFEGHPSIRKLVLQGYQIITF